MKMVLLRIMNWYLIIIMITWPSFNMAQDETDWTKQCNKCKCVWSSGKKTANCTFMSLNEIPNDLSPAIREIDFSYNPLYELTMHVFTRSQMRDIHKMKLQNCSISKVDKTAFEGLRLVIELDLSKNSIRTLDRDTFKDNQKLRILILSDNYLKRLVNGLFLNMTHLQRILLGNNKIDTIENYVFQNLQSLQHIDLSNNKLVTINFDFTKDLDKLSSLSLEGNPWKCDCHLEPFRNKIISKNYITSETYCEEPDRLKHKQWTDSVIFACSPNIVQPIETTSVDVNNSNITLKCKVVGDPKPTITWISNGRLLNNYTNKELKQRYELLESSNNEFVWSNLTIISVGFRDKGEYRCLAKNDGGTDEKNITLSFSGALITTGGVPALMQGNSLAVIIGVAIGALIMLIIVVLLLLRCRKHTSQHRPIEKGGEKGDSYGEDINMSSHQDMEKSLITNVNPVTKPPRIVMGSSLANDGTEVSEAKRNLLDSDSLFAVDDESRSLEFEPISYRRPKEPMDEFAYPPDLLYSHINSQVRSQVSPAGSAASTVVMDSNRMPAHHGPQSPLHSPTYDLVYRTLPHSRSQSPFVGIPARVSRQGYVTIPRKPRQSWSSEGPEIAEPLYDNLGKRTTVDGSSVSLNKLDALTPKSNRSFPLSPCDPIAEHESPPAAATLPRNMNLHKLSPSQTNWAKSNAEALRSPDRRNSFSSIPSDQNKITKIPPRPPPKPKKHVTTGPLYEDEGEDGTEV